jgi:Predicted transcriptional regulators
MINLNGSILEGIILSTIVDCNNGTYGYEITNQIRKDFFVPEVTIYSALNRLEQKNCIKARNEIVKGRNRKIFTITVTGIEELHDINKDWSRYSKQVCKILKVGLENTSGGRFNENES